MSKISLDDAFPDKPEFKLSKTGKTYSLRIPTLEDDDWFKKNYGDQKQIKEMFDRLDWPKLIVIIYHLLDQKEEFLAQKAKIIDDSGRSKNVELTGPEVLLKTIRGPEGMKVLGALNRAMALSNPVIDEFMKEQLKKNVAEMKALTHGQSSTRSRQNTAGRSNTSVAARGGR